MTRTTRSLLLSSILLSAIGFSACSDDTTDDNGTGGTDTGGTAGAGGKATGGRATGGKAGAGTAGVGGVAKGGAAGSGTGNGGAVTGGTGNGGAAAGGAATGGRVTGGTAGVPGTGGAIAGAPGTGGAMAGAPGTGGAMAGAPGTGGAMAGAPGTGGAMAGAPGTGGATAGSAGAPGTGGTGAAAGAGTAGSAGAAFTHVWSFDTLDGWGIKATSSEVPRIDASAGTTLMTTLTPGIATWTVPFVAAANTAITQTALENNFTAVDMTGKTITLRIRWVSGGIGVAAAATGGFDVYIVASDADLTAGTSSLVGALALADRGAAAFQSFTYTVPAGAAPWEPTAVRQLSIRLASRYWTADPQPVFDYTTAVFEIDSVTY